MMFTDWSSGVFRIWQRGGHGERAEREPITGVCGRSPQRGPGAEPLVGGSGGRSPPEAETLFAFERSIEAANSLIFFWNLLENGKKRTFSYKVVCKNFHGRAKGGASHRASPP